MLQTLFTIPHSWLDGPLLVAWLVLGVLYFAWLWKQHGNSGETWSFLPVFAIIAVAIYLVVPHLEATGINPLEPNGPRVKQGLSIRGYGLCLLLGILGGVYITTLRCHKAGLTPDRIVELGFAMMVGGIGGARLFYVFQKRDQFFADGMSLTDSLLQIVNMTQGGLVVYGSLIGGSLFAIGYLLYHKLPLLRTADLIAPGMVLGLAIGRIGCLMNGCCYGGVCDLPLPSVTFPAGSGAYMQQLHEGDLLGLGLAVQQADGFAQVTHVEPGSLAAQWQLTDTDAVALAMPDSMQLRAAKAGLLPPDQELVGRVFRESGSGIEVPVSRLPDRSLRTHPTQIYSSINAFLLAMFLWCYWPHRKSDGEVFGLMLIIYPLGRFLIEIIRQDEAGQFGTRLTISQWVSAIVVLVGFSLLAYAQVRRPKASESGEALM